MSAVALIAAQVAALVIVAAVLALWATLYDNWPEYPPRLGPCSRPWRSCFWPR